MKNMRTKFELSTVFDLLQVQPAQTDRQSAVSNFVSYGKAGVNKQRKQNSYLLLRLVAIFLFALLRRFRFFDWRVADFVTMRQVRLPKILQPN